MLKTSNPATGEALSQYKMTSAAELEDRVRSSYWRYQSWRRESIQDRADVFKNLSELLRAETQRLAELITSEMGKPIVQAQKEVEKCAWLCDYYSKNAKELLKDQSIVTEKEESFLTFQPLGPVLGVMPWNFPFWQVLRFAVPAIVAGNTVLLKHARNTTGCALEIHDLFDRANFPDFVFQTLLLGHDEVKGLIARDEVRAVSVTGSERTGQELAQTAGAHLKKTVLELGGSDPYVILSDADLDHAVPTCLTARLVNNGQSCVAAKRFIVTDELYDDFVSRLCQLAAKTTIGDPMNESTDLGPLAREDLREQLERQVKSSLEQGAQELFRSPEVPSQGFYHPVVILGDVKPGMVAFDEETFGPVAACIRAQNDEEAIELANQSRYGLGAAVFTSDKKRGLRIARERLDVGVCVINGQVQSDPRLPFGGVKNSGYGRELGILGLHEFTNQKTVYM